VAAQAVKVVTLTDEGTINSTGTKNRRRKIYSDVLGRVVKSEILNLENDDVYSTTVNTYNVRDQLTNMTQYAGPTSSEVFQDTTIIYDGYGRLFKKHTPSRLRAPSRHGTTTQMTQ
jgi:hypothetical protein